MSDDFRNVLDQGALDALDDVTGGDPEFFAELVHTFLDDAPTLIAGMRRGLATGDASEVRRLAHGLKSNGRDFGATRFADLCATLEHNTADGQLASATDMIDTIETEFATVKRALEAYINA